MPCNFSILFNSADVIYDISEKTLNRFRINNYRDVLDYVKPDNISIKIAQKLIKRINIDIVRKVLYAFLYATPRQKRFFIDSGLQSFVLKKIKKIDNRNFKYLRMGEFYDFVKNKITDLYNLGDWFQINFQYLSDMIADGFLIQPLKKNILFNSYFDNIQIMFFERFFNSKKRLIFRTRNFKNKATVHNSKWEVFFNLAEQLLIKGFMIVNLGCPLLSLNIQHSNYLEIDHNLDLEVELDLCIRSDAVVMTAEAGLFTGFAAAPITIIQIDDEWSTQCLKTPVSLMRARKKLGIRDIDIRSYIKEKKYEKAVEAITMGLETSNHSEFVKEQKPKKLYEI